MIAGLIGIMVGLGVGAGCRYFDIPCPAPPRVVGALLLIAMTLGILSADIVLGGKSLLVWP